METAKCRSELALAALRLSREMLEFAQQGRWDALGAMQEERERLMAALFAVSEPDQNDAGEWVGIVREIQVVNEALVAQATEQRDQLGQELRGFRNARKVDSAYAQAMNFEG